ncbi:glycosyltransferase WbsX family protein [Butyrivibrio sp. MB2005]|uniref:glycosyltransferase WbsX family protein n=1 Tax=Butyrivibrio sp. MB2005 TaxID=1280678 RepID=UPI0004157AE7|nr:glycoside hydrolase family 99-like domain-containing protein [Butyrivibrio sp. MB2005]
MKTKIVAMHLPQFHRIPENDKWWGEGFTEWTNVKKAVPLFEGHYQPRIPYGQNYYDLSEKDGVIKQMKCAKEYGLDGFCFYHYWFDGKKLLEKPLEALLNEEELPLDFCLCWANESWTRKWDGQNGSEHTLIAQEYGKEKEWKDHFDYLLQFFRHKNYLKHEGLPVFIIYNGADIQDRMAMQDCWNACAKDAGLKGIYFIYSHRLPMWKEIPMTGDAWMDFEPFATMHHLYQARISDISHKFRGIADENKEREFSVIDYSEFCKIMVSRYMGNENHFPGFFVGWDNSARVGANFLCAFDNNSPEIVEKYFRIQYERSINEQKVFLFINAWNEWGECTYLEADERYGFGYLEAIRNVVIGKM